jgi:hypothetical protein
MLVLFLSLQLRSGAFQTADDFLQAVRVKLTGIVQGLSDGDNKLLHDTAVTVYIFKHILSV